MAITQKEFHDAKEALAGAKTEVDALTKQLEEANRELQQTRTALSFAEKRAVNAESTAQRLKDELAALPAEVTTVLAQHQGPRADEPRILYRAQAPVVIQGITVNDNGRLVESLEAAEALQAAEPGLWFNSAADAEDAFNNAPLTEVPQEVQAPVPA